MLTAASLLALLYMSISSSRVIWERISKLRCKGLFEELVQHGHLKCNDPFNYSFEGGLFHALQTVSFVVHCIWSLRNIDCIRICSLYCQ